MIWLRSLGSAQDNQIQSLYENLDDVHSLWLLLRADGRFQLEKDGDWDGHRCDVSYV